MEKTAHQLTPECLERISRLRELGAAYVAVHASTKPASEAEPGQIWSTNPSSSKDPRGETPVWVLVLQKLPGRVRGRHLFEAAPLFPETELAGPHDALLPAGIAGFQCAAALGTRLTILQDSLADYQATVPPPLLQWLNSFCGRKNKPEAPGAIPVYTGAPYLGQSDIRIRFHQELAERLDHLWAPVALALDTTSIDFGVGTPSANVTNRRRFRPLGHLAPAQPAFAAGLLRTSPAESAAIKRVPLNKWFSNEVRQRRLNWLKSIRIQRAGDESSPSFAAFCETTRAQKKKSDFGIVITLLSSEGASARVSLGPLRSSQVFSGHELPYDWSRLTYSITIE
jgi:hypothetical protein